METKHSTKNQQLIISLGSHVYLNTKKKSSMRNDSYFLTLTLSRLSSLNRHERTEELYEVFSPEKDHSG